MELHQLTATALQKMLASRQISSQEIVKALLARIENVDPAVRAFITLCPAQALEAAKASDARRSQNKPLGKLEGIPVAIKDNICTQGITTTCASKMLAHFVPPYDAHVVERIKAEGGIILGKTNLDEFAMGSSCENSAMFPTKNPWHLAYTPGGSSGGSAAALAAGMSPLALGSDTGGSVRQPACMTGTFGLKPTYGRVSRFGLVAFASSLDQIGCMARSVEDVALLSEVVSGHDERDATSVDRPVPACHEELPGSLKGIKIGIPKEYFVSEMDTEVAAACRKALDALCEAGASLREVSLPSTKYAIPAYYLIAPAEASSNLARYDGMRYGYRSSEKMIAKRLERKGTGSAHMEQQAGLLEELYRQSRAEGFGAEVKRRILLGTYALASGYYDDYYLKALKVRTLLHREVEAVVKDVDLLVTPTSPMLPFELGEKVADPLTMYLCDLFTVTFSLSGHPAISVPCGFSKNNLPIGLQIVGRLFDEQSVLRAAYAYSLRAPKMPMPEPKPAGKKRLTFAKKN
jgi:aspartyl-tRNA(Asn)/glutamyl-tRNA(Gln) amidotransferase subunit A